MVRVVFSKEKKTAEIAAPISGFESLAKVEGEGSREIRTVHSYSSRGE